MIRHIHIKDFILIEEETIFFSSGFTAITGETGAGKSILIGAIGLILGDRADFRAIREGASKAIIEAECDLSSLPNMPDLFQSLNLDYSDFSILRREITQQGKSRAFINDTPVSVSTLRTVGQYLVDIHSQHHNMLIGDPAFQMNVVDLLAQNAPILAEYQCLYDKYRKAQKKLEETRKEIEAERNQLDLARFQFEELQQASLSPGEDIEVEERMKMLQHAQEIREVLAGISSLCLDTTEGLSPYEQIAALERKLQALSSYFSYGNELYDRLHSLRMELNDLSSTASSLLSDSELDESELIRLENRYDTLQTLLYKYKLPRTEDLIAERDRLQSFLAKIDNSEEVIALLSEELSAAHEHVIALASELTSRRLSATEAILPDLHSLLAELGISGASFRVSISPLPAPGPLGADHLEFLLATNKHSVLHPIHEIASGGEISRFMLALKTLLSRSTVLPTVIFDEIDTGVSGEVAQKLGNVMKRLSRHLQVIAITHLPQIAALADHHWVVRKKEGASSYITTLSPLRDDARVEEIASMLSGSSVTPQAMDNARVLLQNSTTYSSSNL